MSNNVAFATDLVLQNAAGTNGNGAAMSVGGMGTVTIQVTGTFGLTVVPEGNVDGTWLPLLCVNLANGIVTAGTITAAGTYLIPLSGSDQFRARVSAYVSGTVTVTAKAPSGAPGLVIVTGTPSGTPVPVNLNQVGNATLGIGQQSMQQSIPVVIASNQSNLPTTGAADVTAAVSIGAVNTPSNAINGAGLNSVACVLTGTWSATVVPQISVNGTDWKATQFYDPNAQASGTPSLLTGVTANGTYQIVGTGGTFQVRLFTTAYASGTVGGTLRGSSQGNDTITAQLSSTGQTAKAGAATVVLAYDTFAWPNQLNANAFAGAALQPAGGQGPVLPLPVSSDAILMQICRTNYVLDEIKTLIAQMHEL